MAAQNNSSFLNLKNSALLEVLASGSRNFLEKQGTCFILQKKNGTPSEHIVGNGIHIIVEGKAFLSCISQDGKKIILDILEEGDVFGDLNFFEKNIYSDRECLFIEPLSKTPLKIRKFKKEEFLNILAASPLLAQKVISALAKRLYDREKKIEALAFLDLKSRLLGELVKLGNRQIDNENLIRVNSKITHEKLAEMTGAVRETVSKALAQLKRDGLILSGQGKHIIVDLEKNRENTLYSQ